MNHIPYVGNGPYCYTNSFAMMLGKEAPSTAVIEFATSSPFGLHFINDNVVFFDPFGWTPIECFDAFLRVAGL